MAALVVGAVVVFALATAFALGAIWARERRAPRREPVLLPQEAVLPLPPSTRAQIERAARANRMFVPVARPSAPLIAERDAFDEDTFS